MLGGKLRDIYEKYGVKSVYPIIYLIFFLANFLSAIGMTYPATDPNELCVIGISQFFTGKSWAGVMCSVDYYYGFLQGILYVPAMLIFRNPQLQYAAIGTINAIIISFVPVLSFSIGKRLGIEKLWKLLAIAFVTGGYCCYFAHSKFAWTETVTIILPWLILRLLLIMSEIKNKAKTHALSVMLGLLCSLCLAAHVRLIAVILTVVTVIIAERIFYSKKSVYLNSFIPSFAVGTAGVLAVTHILITNLWCCDDPAKLNNTLSHLFSSLGGEIQNSSARFIQTIFGQLYYFITSTWGFGAVALCLFGAMLSHNIKMKRSGEAQTYSHSISIIGVFSFFSAIFTVLASTLYRFATDGFYTYQDNVIFGRFLDGIIPFAFLFVLAILFTTSVKINKILGAAVITAIIFLVFFTITVPVILECNSTRIAPILSLYPLRVGADTELLDFNTLLLTVSMVFCILSVFVVVVSCTKKYRSAIISTILCGLTIYSLVFISGTYLPMCRNESVIKNSAVADISDSVYNQNGAPPLTLYNLSRHDALMLQFLNTNVNVRITYDIETIPENCFVAVKSSEDVSALLGGRMPFLLIDENDSLRLYAYGDRAVAYMRSQNVDESEQEAENTPLITIAESTTTPITTTTPASPERTSFTTERTPIITTYNPPEVITSHADQFGEEAEWAEIE